LEILTENIKRSINRSIIGNIKKNRYDLVTRNILKVIDRLYANIPDNKRISYGIVHVLNTLTDYLHAKLNESNLLQAGTEIFENSTEFKIRSIGLGLISCYGLIDYSSVKPYFRMAAADEYWDMRETAAHFFRRIIRKYPKEVKPFLIECVKADDPNVRRFASETLRPVSINQWIQTNPDYSLSILKHLFKEKVPYPRTSVGNNLSDLARRNPEIIYGIVDKLVKSGNKNSYWIAYRACRNLVKKEPQRVMDLLGIDEYKYKDRQFRRNEH
jgi:3-methyladenine DNA glycosylase AlkC